MKRFLRNVWFDLWAGEPPISVMDAIRRFLDPAKECTRCHGLGEEPENDQINDPIARSFVIACSRCGGNGLEPR